MRSDPLPVGANCPPERAITASDTGVTELLAEVTELHEALAEAKAAYAIAEARVDTVKAEAPAARELANRLTAELAEVHRPWWRRLIG
jgi:hypothetical protein